MPAMLPLTPSCSRSTVVVVVSRPPPSARTGRGSATVLPRIDRSALTFRPSPSAGSTSWTVTVMSGGFSASKKSADRRWLSRGLIPVVTDAALTSIRPVTIPPASMWPSPLNLVKRPLTFISPHIVLFLNENDDRFGSNVHVPTACGLFKSSVTLDISPPLSGLIQQWRQIRGIEVLVDAADQPVATDGDDDPDAQRVRRPVPRQPV